MSCYPFTNMPFTVIFPTIIAIICRWSDRSIIWVFLTTKRIVIQFNRFDTEFFAIRQRKPNNHFFGFFFFVPPRFYPFKHTFINWRMREDSNLRVNFHRPLAFQASAIGHSATHPKTTDFITCQNLVQRAKPLLTSVAS